MANLVENPIRPKKLQDHVQALVTLHRTLLYESYDLFLASHHPSASPELEELPAINSKCLHVCGSMASTASWGC